jgi:translation initiation factor IF-1
MCAGDFDMPGAGAFRVEGVIVAVRPNGTYRARLANGHELTAFVAGRAKQAAPRWIPGDNVSLVVSSYDLSEGRIVVEARQV